MKFRGFYLFSVNGSKSVVGSIGPSVSIKGSSLDSSGVVTVVTETVTVTKTVSMTETVSVTVASQTSIVTSIGTGVQNSRVSFGLSLPFANSVDNRSDSVVGSIGPSVSVKGSSLDGSGVVTVVTKTVTVT